MTAAWPVLAFASALAGFASLSLAMDRHHEDCHGRGHTPGHAKRRGLQIGGTLALLVSLWASLVVEGRAQGWVLWLGALTVAALATVLTLSFAPRALVRLQVVAAGLSVVGLLAGLALG